MKTPMSLLFWLFITIALHARSPQSAFANDERVFEKPLSKTQSMVVVRHELLGADKFRIFDLSYDAPSQTLAICRRAGFVTAEIVKVGSPSDARQVPEPLVRERDKPGGYAAAATFRGAVSTHNLTVELLMTPHGGRFIFVWHGDHWEHTHFFEPQRTLLRKRLPNGTMLLVVEREHTLPRGPELPSASFLVSNRWETRDPDMPPSETPELPANLVAKLPEGLNTVFVLHSPRQPPRQLWVLNNPRLRMDYFQIYDATVESGILIYAYILGGDAYANVVRPDRDGPHSMDEKTKDENIPDFFAPPRTLLSPELHERVVSARITGSLRHHDLTVVTKSARGSTHRYRLQPDPAAMMHERWIMLPDPGAKPRVAP